MKTTNTNTTNKKTTNTTASTVFDFGQAVNGLELGAEYTDTLKAAVKAWNDSQQGSDLSVKYDKISVRTLDGKITALNKGSQYAALSEELVKVINKEVKGWEDDTVSRKKVHNLLTTINNSTNQKIKLTAPVEKGLTECLAGRRMAGYTYTRKLSDITKVLVRTYWAVLNGKLLAIAYKGLDS